MEYVYIGLSMYYDEIEFICTDITFAVWGGEIKACKKKNNLCVYRIEKSNFLDYLTLKGGCIDKADLYDATYRGCTDFIFLGTTKRREC